MVRFCRGILPGLLLTSLASGMPQQPLSFSHLPINLASHQGCKSASDSIQGDVRLGRQAFVLDLRGNRGGFMNQTLCIANLFLAEGKIVTYARRLPKGGETTLRTSQKPLTRAPVVVLVDRNTAGAAEVLAAALQDHRRALVAVERTACAGPIRIDYRYVAFFSPKGRALATAGVTPSFKTFEEAESALWNVRLEEYPWGFEIGNGRILQLAAPFWFNFAWVPPSLPRI